MNSIRTEGERVTKLFMVIGLVVMVSMMLSGCGASKYLPVSKKKYEAAVADMESAKIEFEKSQMMRDAVEQENDKLKDENEKVAMDLEMMALEIRRIREGRESEREQLSVREAEVVEESQMLMARVRKFQQEYQKIKSQNRSLRDTVRRYKKELKEARQAKVAQAARVPKNMSSQKPQSQTKPVRVSKPIKRSLVPVNINTATVDDLVLFLGLTKNMAEKVIANRPYRLRGELVAKKVVPRATFDVIKDRISAAPK